MDFRDNFTAHADNLINYKCLQNFFICVCKPYSHLNNSDCKLSNEGYFCPQV